MAISRSGDFDFDTVSRFVEALRERFEELYINARQGDILTFAVITDRGQMRIVGGCEQAPTDPRKLGLRPLGRVRVSGDPENDWMMLLCFIVGNFLQTLEVVARKLKMILGGHKPQTPHA